MNFSRLLCRRTSTILTSIRTWPQTSAITTAASRTTIQKFSVTVQNRKLQANVQPQPAAPLKDPTDCTVPRKPMKKKRPRKKKPFFNLHELSAQGFFNVTAFATADEYDLESLLEGLKKQDLYDTKKFFSTDNLGAALDVLYVTAKYQVGTEMRDIFFFRDGSIVLWNFNDIETNNVLSFLRSYEKEAYLRPLVRCEKEVMPYTYIPRIPVDVDCESYNEEDECTRAFFHNGRFFLCRGEENFFQKYTFSNAMVTSIKLGIWEATLDCYIDSMQYLTDDLKRGRRIRITRSEALRKTGELLALRHDINLSSDLLDTPDFYWDREDLEQLYLQVCAYFSINRRTKVMNEKINHCIELADLISHNLNDAHHIRLEWMIIILIMVEVGFEVLHYAERYLKREKEIGPVPLTQ